MNFVFLDTVIIECRVYEYYIFSYEIFYLLNVVMFDEINFFY